METLTVSRVIGNDYAAMVCGACGTRTVIVYLRMDSVVCSIVEQRNGSTSDLVMSRRELGGILTSPKIPNLQVVEVWRSVCRGELELPPH